MDTSEATLSFLRKGLTLLVLILPAIASACSMVGDLGASSEPDTSILTEQPCEPPCWYGITSGVTKRDEAKRLLQQNPHIRQQSLQEDRGGFGWIAQRGGLNQLYVRDEVVRVLSLTPTFSLSVGQLVDHYGNPEKVLVWYAVIPEDVNRQWQAKIYYPHQGLVAFFYTKRPTDSSHLLVERDLIVKTLEFLPKDSIDGMFVSARGVLPDNQWGQDARRRLQDWHGFDVYDFSTDILRP